MRTTPNPGLFGIPCVGFLSFEVDPAFGFFSQGPRARLGALGRTDPIPKLARIQKPGWHCETGKDSKTRIRKLMKRGLVNCVVQAVRGWFRVGLGST